jgi:hypothetical protein
MSSDENHPPTREPSRKRGGSALHLGPRKKSYAILSIVERDLPSSGLHPIRLFCMVGISAGQCLHCATTLLSLLQVYFGSKNCKTVLSKIIQQSEYNHDNSMPPALNDTFNLSVRREHRVFMELVDSYPGLLERLTNGEEEDIILVGELVSLQCLKVSVLIILQLGKGASGARGDDTKTLKSAVLEWLVPRGQVVTPPLSRNIKSDCGFNHEVTGALLCPAGLDWSNAE